MIVIVDYGMGNLGSILNMLRRLGVSAAVSADPEQVERAEKLILPGVGAFEKGMAKLEQTGLVPILNRRVLEQGTPVLGICLGLQLMTRCSEEGARPGLAWLDAETVRFKSAEPAPFRLKIPHMGWNHVTIHRDNPLVASGGNEQRFYFVHSYHLVCHSEAEVVGTTHYGYDFPSLLVRGNIAGTQFHPEKSHRFGMALLRSFAQPSPS
jgi:glutamine amidotransferase